METLSLVMEEETSERSTLRVQRNISVESLSPTRSYCSSGLVTPSGDMNCLSPGAGSSTTSSVKNIVFRRKSKQKVREDDEGSHQSSSVEVRRRMYRKEVKHLRRVVTEIALVRVEIDLSQGIQHVFYRAELGIRLNTLLNDEPARITAAARIQRAWRGHQVRAKVLPEAITHVLRLVHAVRPALIFSRSRLLRQLGIKSPLFRWRIKHVMQPLVREAGKNRILSAWRASCVQRRAISQMYTSRLAMSAISSMPSRRRLHLAVLLSNRKFGDASPTNIVSQISRLGSDAKSHYLFALKTPRTAEELSVSHPALKYQRQVCSALLVAFWRGCIVRCKALPAALRKRLHRIRLHDSNLKVTRARWDRAFGKRRVLAALHAHAVALIIFYWRFSYRTRRRASRMYSRGFVSRLWDTAIPKNRRKKVFIELRLRSISSLRKQLTTLTGIANAMTCRRIWGRVSDLQKDPKHVRRGAQIVQCRWRGYRCRLSGILRNRLQAVIEEAWRSNLVLLRRLPDLCTALGFRSAAMQKRIEELVPNIAALCLQRAWRKHSKYQAIRFDAKSYAKELSTRAWSKIMPFKKAKILVKLRNRRVDALRDCLVNDRIILGHQRGGLGDRAHKKIQKLMLDSKHQLRAAVALQAWWRGCRVRELLDARLSVSAIFGRLGRPFPSRDMKHVRGICHWAVHLAVGFTIGLHRRVQRRKAMHCVAQKIRARGGDCGEEGFFPSTLLEQKMRVLSKTQRAEQQRTYQEVFKADGGEHLLLSSVSGEDGDSPAGCDHEGYFRLKTCKAVERYLAGTSSPSSPSRRNMAVDKAVVEAYMEQRESVATRCKALFEIAVDGGADVDSMPIPPSSPLRRSPRHGVPGGEFSEMRLDELEPLLIHLDSVVSPSSSAKRRSPTAGCSQEADRLDVAALRDSKVLRALGVGCRTDGAATAAFLAELRARAEDGREGNSTDSRILRALEVIAITRIQAFCRAISARSLARVQVARQYTKRILQRPRPRVHGVSLCQYPSSSKRDLLASGLGRDEERSQGA